MKVYSTNGDITVFGQDVTSGDVSLHTSLEQFLRFMIQAGDDGSPPNVVGALEHGCTFPSENKRRTRQTLHMRQHEYALHDV